MEKWGETLAPRPFDPANPADVAEVNRIYEQQLRPGLKERNVRLPNWIVPIRFFVAKTGVVPDGLYSQAETLLESDNPENRLIGAQMISSLHDIAPKSMDRFDQEKILFARDIVKLRYGEGPETFQDTETAVAMAEKNRPANAARLKKEEEERREKERAEQEKYEKPKASISWSAWAFTRAEASRISRRPCTRF